MPLTWDVFFYTVLISEFHADYRNGQWIPYHITCTVLRDEASGLVQSIVSVATAALGDVGTAVGYASQVGLDLSAVQAALAAPGASTRGTAAYAAAQSSLVDAQTSIDDSVTSADTTLANLDFADIVAPQDGVTALLDATSAAGQLSSLTAARPYVTRTAINLANAST